MFTRALQNYSAIPTFLVVLYLARIQPTSLVSLNNKSTKSKDLLGDNSRMVETPVVIAGGGGGGVKPN